MRQLFSEIYANDSYVFTQVEKIHYCPKDKRSLPDRFVEGTCPNCGFRGARGDQCDNCGRPLDAEKLIDPYCVICKSKTELRDTTQWWFDLPKLSGYISDFLDRAELSENVIRFSRGWIKDGLRPRSITRDTDWGIQAPFPGAENKTIYVWLDAVLGYVSAAIEYFEKGKRNPEGWKEYWFNPETRTSYFIGKDNIPFHAIILPSLLRASGKAYNEPYLISSTEFLNFEKQKFSKSRKIGIWIDEALQIIPPDYWRYYLIAIRPENGDGEFLWSEFAQKINNDLNDAIGNFVNRTLVGVEKFSSGSFTIDKESFSRDASQQCKDQLAQSIERHSKIKDLYDQTRLQSACKASVEQAFEANRFLSVTEPWKVVKTDRKKANEILYVALSILKLLSIELSPIIPSSSEEMVRQAGFFKSASGVPSWDRTSLDEDLPISVSEPRPIFSKVSSDKLRERLKEIRAAKKE